MTEQQFKNLPRLSYMRKADLERVYGLKVYTDWKKVPDGLMTRTQAIHAGIDDRKGLPVAIKSSLGTKSAYYLYNCAFYRG